MLLAQTRAKEWIQLPNENEILAQDGKDWVLLRSNDDDDDRKSGDVNEDGVYADEKSEKSAKSRDQYSEDDEDFNDNNIL